MSTTYPATAPPVLRKEDPLALYWNEKVSSLATIEQFHFSEEEKERHRIYSLALMKLVWNYWNGNRKGMIGEYFWREKQQWRPFKGLYRCHAVANDNDAEPPVRDYLGHNIAALAVDGDGDIIDFEFNHNIVFSSSVEHAESRLIRRIFSLTLLDDGWNLATKPNPTAPATFLDNVTLYTSLEPCAQCAGIMTLAGVKEVVYLQKDFGTYCISNILYNLTTFKQQDPNLPPPKPIAAPRPIPACDFELPHYQKLNEGYAAFFASVQEKPFWKDGTASDKAQSVVSFLCTDNAYEIYADAVSKFNNLALSYKNFVPPPIGENPPKPLSNKEALEGARAFLATAIGKARRGTPHRL